MELLKYFDGTIATMDLYKKCAKNYRKQIFSAFILPPPEVTKKKRRQGVRPNLLAGPANILDTKPSSITGGVIFFLSGPGMSQDLL